MHGFLLCAIFILHTQVQHVCKAESEVETEALVEEDRVSEVEVEVPVTEDTSIIEPVTEATEERVIEAFNTDQASAEAEPAADKMVAETAVESVETKIPEPEQVTEAVKSAAPAEDKESEAEVKVLAEEHAPEVPAEPVTIAEVHHLCFYVFLTMQSNAVYFLTWMCYSYFIV